MNEEEYYIEIDYGCIKESEGWEPEIDPEWTWVEDQGHYECSSCRKGPCTQ